MKLAIPNLYSEYGRYSDAFRAIPFHKDCLKPVERRLLFTLHNIARKKFIKAIRVVGDCSGKYHPHGDESTYQSLVQLVNRGFAVGQGNWGYINLHKISAAQMRYPEVSANINLDDFFSEFLKYINFHDPENLSELQPEFLPTPVPLGIIGSGLTSGISFNITRIPRYPLSDLINRLEYLLLKEVNPNEPVRTIIPAFDNCDVYETSPGDFENILTTGIGSIFVIPKIEVHPTFIRILGKPPTGLTSLISKETENQYSIIDQSDLKNGFILEVSPSNKRIDQQFINTIFEIIKTKINIICNVVKDDNTVTTMPIDTLIRNSYDRWVNAFELKLKDDRLKLENKIFTIKVIGIVREIIVNNNINIKQINNIIQIFKTQYQSKYPNINEEDISRICSKNSIKQLIEYDLDMSSLLAELQVVINDVNNINQVAFQKVLLYK
jgi:DNA gyrase/topoisomerase IV subunit A